MPTNPMEYVWPGIIVAQAMHVAAKLQIPRIVPTETSSVIECRAVKGGAGVGSWNAGGGWPMVGDFR